MGKEYIDYFNTCLYCLERDMKAGKPPTVESLQALIDEIENSETHFDKQSDWCRGWMDVWRFYVKSNGQVPERLNEDL